MNKQELFFQKNNKYILMFIMAVNIGQLIYWLFQKDIYYIVLSAAAIIFPFVPQIFYKVFRLKPVNTLTFISRIFIFLAFNIGMVMKGYMLIPYYDKAVHTLSGVFFGFVGLLMFYFFKYDKRIEKHDFPLSMVFSFSFSMMIAAIWEIYEYFISMLLGTDPQGVLMTGVGDTMQDIIVCLIGTVIFCFYILRYYRRSKRGILMSAFESFVEFNFS